MVREELRGVLINQNEIALQKPLTAITAMEIALLHYVKDHANVLLQGYPEMRVIELHDFA